MRFVQMHTNGPEANASAEANQRIKDDKQVARCGVANGGERGRLEENRLVKDVLKVDLNGLDPQALHPQPPCQVIHWERFLHVRTLKVLLVENDDSTRHIVSVLLRYCSYEVIAVSNGLQAWKILEDISIHIDIVLSEVVMPVLSGIALLSKIMNHKTRKTTPVITLVNQTHVLEKPCSRRLAHSFPSGVTVLADYGLAGFVGLARWPTLDSSPSLSTSRTPPPHF